MSPLATGKIKLKHRFGLSGRVTNLSEGPGLSTAHLAYFSERIQGGASVLVNDPIVIHQSSQVYRTQLGLVHNEEYAALIQACHQAQVPAIQPLLHLGAHGCAATAFHAAWSPSGMPSSRDQDGSHMLSEAEIQHLLCCYEEEALKAKQLGFSGVEIIAGGDGLIEQFWNPRSNLRTDQWGGDFEGRMRFSLVLIERLRQSLGDDFLIGMVMTDQSGYGTQLTHQELERVLRSLVQNSDIDYYSFSYARDEEQIKNYREIVADKLFVLTGELLDLEQMVHAQDLFRADWLALDKALLADPYLPQKLQSEQPEQIRPCISCYQQCHARIKRDIFVSCLVNPSVGHEQLLPEHPSNVQQSLRILVIGGGLAGMESARYAAESGYQVSLVERQQQLGGSWSLAARIPGRERLSLLTSWYQDALKRLGVSVDYGTEVTEDYLRQHSFDQLIIACGADQNSLGFQRRLPNFNRLPGLENGIVVTVEDVLAGRADLPGHGPLLILDDIGNWQGLGTALYLSEQGYQVTVVSRHSQPAPELAGHPEYERYMRRAVSAGIEWINDALLMQWHGDFAAIYTRQTGTTEPYVFAALILATTLNANHEVEQWAVQQGYPHVLAGDCQGVRRAHMAIYEGRMAVHNMKMNDDNTAVQVTSNA